jgi:hypothetical protein
MGRQVFETSLNPEIFIQSVAGDLNVRGWDSPQVAVTADPDELEVDQVEDRLTISCSGDLDLRLPIRSTVHIDSCAGDASLKLLEQTLQVGEIAGSLDVRNVAAVHLGSVAGNLSVKNASGDVNVDAVAGNADLRVVLGACRLNNVDGNLELQNVEGEILANADGNARLRLNRLAAGDFTVTADGNIYCYLPEDASARLSMNSDGETIKVRLPDSARTYRQNQCDLTLGGGGDDTATNMTLVADGAIYLFADQGGWSSGDSSFTGLPDDFGQQIARQVESQIQSQMEEVTRNLNEQMEQLSSRLTQAGLSPEETERIVEQAMRNSERETTRAQEKMRRAQEKLERKLDAQRRKAESKAQAADRRSRRSWGFEWPSPPPSPPPPQPPFAGRNSATEEERLMILRMLEQKKITLEEADKLLSALESKE